LRWSVSLQTEGDRVIELDEVVELADAVAASNGIASGMGTYGYGVQVVVEADHNDRAVELAMAVLAGAVEKSGLPSWPVISVETIAEDEEMFYDMVEE
jgi:hypothetical protein